MLKVTHEISHLSEITNVRTLIHHVTKVRPLPLDTTLFKHIPHAI